MEEAGGKEGRDEGDVWLRDLKCKKSGKELREDGGFSWWQEYEVLRRTYELSSEYGPVLSWKEKIKMRNEKDWVEE